MGKPILRLNDVTKMYNSFCGVRDISFSLKKGEVLGLLGKNGAGKTTIIKLIMNLISKDRGKISVFGQENGANEKEIKKKIGFVYDELYYYSSQSAEMARKNVRRFYPDWKDEKFNYYMEKFDLPYNKKINDFSQGMKMKLGLTLALSHNAELLIMDEPTSGLDPVVREELLDILINIIENDANKAVFISSHIIEDIKKIADRIIIIHDGKVVKDKSKRKFSNYYYVEGNKTLLANNQIKNFINKIEISGGKFKGITNELNKLYNNISKENIQIEKASLEDTLLTFIKGG